MTRWRRSFYPCCEKSTFPEIVKAFFLSCYFLCSWQLFWISIQLECLACCCSFRRSWNFFCLFLLTIVRKSLQLSVEWLHLPCGMQHFLFDRRSTEYSSIDSSTLESEYACLRFLAFFLWDFLAAAEDYFFSSLGSKFSTLVSMISVISLIHETSIEWFISSVGRCTVSWPSV